MDVTWFRTGIGVFLVLTFLYAFFLAGQLLVWFSFLLAAYLLYLTVRFVRAAETIAESSETIAENSNRGGTDADE